MTWIDLTVLLSTLIFIVVYGAWKTRKNKNLEGYLLGNKQMKWHTIGLSVMATQASAITFLSTPGQAYEDGMRFIQFYFGLPIAMVIISVTFVPLYYKLKVFTAYEFLENRFDLKTRLLTAFLFLIQRGLAAGITIFAPAIILSAVLGWDLTLTNIFVGLLVIIYTVTGGAKAVSLTHKHQMAVMMGGMLVALILVVYYITDFVSFGDAVKIAGKMGKMNIVNFSFNITDRYNVWSGITGGLFLALAYFGTDQSQVQRYISGSSVSQSRLGLIFNGFFKIPMQFFILFIGVMVFVFYQFNQPPVYFNETLLNKAKKQHATQIGEWEKKHDELFQKKKLKINELSKSLNQGDEKEISKKTDEINKLTQEGEVVRNEVKGIIRKALPDAELQDTDFVFIRFVMDNLPVGLIGLLLAVIFCAAMSSTSSELNALASVSIIDFYKRVFINDASERHYLIASKIFTFLWGVLAILFAIFAQLLDNLIEAVNILGSLFYGTILGIFLVAFYFKSIKANAVFISALIAETIVIALFFISEIGFLWFNVLGCVLVIIIATIVAFFSHGVTKIHVK